MRHGKRVLVVIPARGGSKGIPRKNITLVAGKPLIAYTTELLRELPWIDHSVVSTDSPEIAAAGQAAGTADVVWRPEDLSGDRIGDMPVLAHALEESEKSAAHRFDVVLMLQPTSPLRTAADVEACVDLLLSGSWDSAWTVSETSLSYHPHKQVKISPNGVLEFYFDSESSIVARQELQRSFHRNGVCYAFTSSFVRNSETVFSRGNSTALVTPGVHISIDTPADILAVDRIITNSSAI